MKLTQINSSLLYIPVLAAILTLFINPLQAQSPNPSNTIEVSLEESPDGDEEDGVLRSGFAIDRGQYVQLPYEVADDNGKVVLNGVVLPEVTIQKSDGGFGQGRRGRRSNMPQAFRVEQILRNDGLLLIVDNTTTRVFSHDDGVQILKILMSDNDKQRQVELLRDWYLDRFPNDDISWPTVVDNYHPHPELTERFKAYNFDNSQEGSQMGQPTFFMRYIQTQSAKYLLTMIGMVLAAFSFGVLLQYRPPIGKRWRELDRTGDGFQLMPRFIALVCVLALFDLACTIIAGQGGVFSEMNPVAGTLMQSPVYLILYKFGVTMLGTFLLLRLRPYHGAQLASWWMCFIYCILTFRWSTFNSLFMG